MRTLALLAMLVGCFGAFAPAQDEAPLPPVAGHRTHVPASALLFPLFDSRAGLGKGSILSVTNINASRMVCANNFRQGDVQLHYYYVEGTEPFNNVFNRFEFLTPNDTLTVLAGSHNPEMEFGYLIVVAEDPESGDTINFNSLIGDEIVVDAQDNRLWAIPAIGFRALYQGPARDRCGRFKTDQNLNGSVDFDGVEYDGYPDKLYIASFFEQSAAMATELVLVSGLGSYFHLDVDFLFYDNEEDAFSRDFEFVCFTRVKLEDISQVTRNLGGSPAEPATGWARIDGDYAVHLLTGGLWTGETGNFTDLDPPFTGAVVQWVRGATGFQFGHLLHHGGWQNGNDFPWNDRDDRLIGEK